MANVNHPRLIVIGASARAAAYSVLRIGLEPIACDLFGDRDLREVCRYHPLRHGNYPGSVLDTLRRLPPLPVVTTGGLENSPRLMARIAGRQLLLGNPAPVLELVRDPFLVRQTLRRADLLFPDIRRGRDGPSDPGGWLQKPLRGSGGAGIQLAGSNSAARGVYFQKRVHGTPAAALFVAGARHARFLGATRQLVGEGWLHAPPFAYCGSVGPLKLTSGQRLQIEAAGDALANAFDLRGLFGLDLVLEGREGERVWTIEVNPRYTASVEVLEHATGLRAIERHLQGCEESELVHAAAAPRSGSETGSNRGVVGKAIVYAPYDMKFLPEPDGARAPQPWSLPSMADIPATGTMIDRGRPVLTLFARERNAERCLDELRRTVRALNSSLAKRDGHDEG